MCISSLYVSEMMFLNTVNSQLQWNLCIVDTVGGKLAVLYREVDLYTTLCGWDGMREVPLIQSVLCRDVPHTYAL